MCIRDSYMTVKRVMGTETEYAVSLNTPDRYNPVQLSFDVVNGAADSIFTKLEPRTERVVSAADIARATTEPPEDTRAWLRAKLVAQFGDEVAAASWSRLTVRDPRAADEGEAVEFYGNAGHMAATDHHLFSLDISDPLAFTKAHCETELNSAEHAIDLLKSLAINAER